MSSIQNPTFTSSNDNERRANPNDPVAYTSEHIPHTTSTGSHVASPENYTASTEHNTNLTQSESRLSGTNNGGMFSNATETAKQYLPTTVVGALQNVGVIGHDTSVTSSTLPSEENKFSGSRGGVGTLPGSMHETGVAKLPEENHAEAKLGHELGREGVLGTDLEERPMGLMDVIAKPSSFPIKLAEERETSAATGVDTAAKFVNLDVLPTPQGTPGEGTSLKQAATESTHRPEQLSEPSKHELDAATHKPLPPVGNIKTPRPSETERPEKNDKTYAEDQAKRKTARTEPSSHSPPASPTNATAPATHTKERKESDVQGDKTDKSGKPSFTQKLKGEVKVITGKLGKNPEKVEQGLAMKKGENVV